MTVIESILAIFTGIGDWIAEAVPKMIPMFYVAETGLTFLGALSIAGLGISVAFLLIGVISRFMKFRG